MDLNDLLRDGVSLDAFIDAAEHATPIQVEATESALTQRGLQILTDLATSTPQDATQASELLGTAMLHLVELGFASRRAASDVEALVFRIAAAMPRGAKGAAAELGRAIRREGQRQAAELRARAPASGRDGVDPQIWDRLAKSESGAPACSWENVCLVLEGDPRWKGRIAHCEFRRRPVLDGAGVERETILQCRRWVEQVYGVRASTDWVREAIQVVASARHVHPIRDYLSSLEWDGLDRLDTMLEDLFHVAPNALTRRYSACWMISAVARVTAPGPDSKVDTMLVLVGPQRTFKSTALRALAGEWFRDTPIELRKDKEAFLALRGSWIHELAELKTFRGIDAEGIRAFLSSAVDSYRPPYGEDQVDVARQCVFAGTYNPMHGQARFLRDPAGSRRFWVVEVEQAINIERIRRQRDQLWAEAVHRYKQGEIWYLDDEEELIRAQLNEAYQEVDHWSVTLNSWLDETEADHDPAYELRVSSRHMASDALGIPPERATGRVLDAVLRVLDQRGYRRVYRKAPGSRKGAWWYVQSDV